MSKISKEIRRAALSRAPADPSWVTSWVGGLLYANAGFSLYTNPRNERPNYIPGEGPLSGADDTTRRTFLLLVAEALE
jgi:hypothetical protein